MNGISFRNTASLAVLMLGKLAYPDDGYISFGGSPKLLSNHRSIAMSSEVVKVHAYDRFVHVEANFTFKNLGKATVVRMGFPDDDSRSEGQDRKRRIGARFPAKESRLIGFRSWVDGKRVRTDLVQGADGNQAWHAKLVRIEHNETKRIRVRYRTETGGGVIGNLPKQNTTRFLANALYVMTTGASWRGPIGYAKVKVQVHSADLKMPFQLVFGENAFQTMLSKLQRCVVWNGFVKPRVYGRIFVFEKRNFEPKEDIHIGWMTDAISRPKSS